MIAKNSLSTLAAGLLTLLASVEAKPLSVLFFTTDDMNHDSPSVCGGPIKDLTPHVDRLATQGMRFEHIYSTVAVCQPVRQIIQTARYPHRNGSMGFFPITPDARTLNEQLHEAGYLISMLGKVKHHQPNERFCLDLADDTMSRHPSRLA
ncbi:MAG TPA: sulfatase-like hydrolase/transferase, partial [Luteolibacter sp.]|nr:sulfatase-like hydrolase/transferase [Luteolibacter sp.]